MCEDEQPASHYSFRLHIIRGCLSIDALTGVGARSVESLVGLVRAVEIKPLPMIIKSALEFLASRK